MSIADVRHPDPDIVWDEELGLWCCPKNCTGKKAQTTNRESCRSHIREVHTNETLYCDAGEACKGFDAAKQCPYRTGSAENIARHIERCTHATTFLLVKETPAGVAHAVDAKLAAIIGDQPAS